MADPALLAGGLAYALPATAEPIERLPLTPAPLAAPGLLGIAVVHGQAVPVHGLGGDAAWVLVATPAGRVVFAGDAIVEDRPGALPLPAPRIAVRPPPAALPAGEDAWVVPARAGRIATRALAAECGPARFALPFAALERVLPLPALHPAPGPSGGALGYALVGDAAVLVLDPATLAPEATAEDATLLVVFRHGGRRLGLPCRRIDPARAEEATVTGRLDQLLPRLGAAPMAQAAPPAAPEPTRSVLLCIAGGQPFALPVEEVAAVIPALAPTPAPPGIGPSFRGVITHRGEVLPVLDAGVQLGLPPVLSAPGQDAPLLRLAVPRPVALAVTQVTGLRQLPLRLVSDVAGDGPVAAVAAMPDHPLPICRASVLAEAVGA